MLLADRDVEKNKNHKKLKKYLMITLKVKPFSWKKKSKIKDPFNSLEWNNHKYTEKEYL